MGLFRLFFSNSPTGFPIPCNIAFLFELHEVVAFARSHPTRGWLPQLPSPKHQALPDKPTRRHNTADLSHRRSSQTLPSDAGSNRPWPSWASSPASPGSTGQHGRRGTVNRTTHKGELTTHATPVAHATPRPQKPRSPCRSRLQSCALFVLDREGTFVLYVLSTKPGGNAFAQIFQQIGHSLGRRRRLCLLHASKPPGTTSLCLKMERALNAFVASRPQQTCSSTSQARRSGPLFACTASH